MEDTSVRVEVTGGGSTIAEETGGTSIVPVVTGG